MTSQGSDQIVSTVSRNIRTARVEAGLTQRALAIALDVDIRAVNRWERAGITPSGQNLAKLAEMLGRDPGWFYTNHERVAA